MFPERANLVRYIDIAEASFLLFVILCLVGTLCSLGIYLSLIAVWTTLA